MRIAMERAGVKPEDVKAVWASESGHRLADAAEAAAIERLFGDRVKIIAPKKLLGEPMGAGAALNAALALKGWQEGDADASQAGVVLVNSQSLGGTHFSIVLAPYGGQ